jgi:hypothetical protein
MELCMEKLSQQAFIDKCLLVHGDKYDYSRCLYKGALSLIEVVCKVHGAFFQKAKTHLYNKAGCMACARAITLSNLEPIHVPNSTKSFIDRSLTIHNGKYDYANSIYVGFKYDVDIICPIHGLFTQQAGTHLLGHGCPICAKKYTDPIARKISRHVSNFIRCGLKKKSSNKNGVSCRKYLPYSFQELREHLEKQFEPWMSWNNWGRYDVKTWDDNDQATWTWQLDHIISQSKLLYSSMEDENFKKCWALENLRPLSAKQNLLDGVNKVR